MTQGLGRGAGNGQRVLVEATGYRRNRQFKYQPYIDLFGESAG